MTRCSRFEQEGLLLLEKNLPLSEHFETCPDCREERIRYDRLKFLVGQLDDDVSPEPGWEDAVLDAVRPVSRINRFRKFIAAVAVLVPVAVMLPLALTWLGQRHGVEELRVELIPSETVYRGEDAKPGDELKVVAVVGDHKYKELRVYLDGRHLVLHCGSSGVDCEPADNDISARIVLRALGEYQSVMVAADVAIPPPTGDMDRDLLAAREAGAKIIVGREIIVR